MNGITKIYGNGVIANKDVSLTVNRGEIHALMGENGAGKSTLMKILFGFEEKDSGEILFDGQNLDGKKPAEIIECGIGMVHQHFMLVESLRVYENVILGMEPKKGLSTDKEAAIRMVKEISEKWLTPLGDEVLTMMRKYRRFSVEELVGWTVEGVRDAVKKCL